MRTQVRITTTQRLAAIAFGALLAAATVLPARAQDPLAVAPAMYKLHFENDRVRVMEVTFKKGEKIAPHSHPDHFVYVLAGGKLELHAGDKVSPVELTPGQIVWIAAETHWAVNMGDTEVRLLVTELKEPMKTATGK